MRESSKGERREREGGHSVRGDDVTGQDAGQGIPHEDPPRRAV